VLCFHDKAFNTDYTVDSDICTSPLQRKGTVAFPCKVVTPTNHNIYLHRLLFFFSCHQTFFANDLSLSLSLSLKESSKLWKDLNSIQRWGSRGGYVGSCLGADTQLLPDVGMSYYEGWNFNSGNYLFTTDTK